MLDAERAKKTEYQKQSEHPEFTREISLIGAEAFDALRSSKVLIIGVGGVGSYTAEAIARAGVGHITLMDGDVVMSSNINRQLVALQSTIGKNKAAVMKTRMADIDSEAEVKAIEKFYDEDTDIDFGQYDFVADAVDDVKAKELIIARCKKAETKVISSMGAAGKFQNEGFHVTDISKTNTCPLAKVMRKRLKELGIKDVPVVFSDEKPRATNGELGTLSFVPGTAGLVMAGYIIRELIEYKKTGEVD